MRAAYDHQLEVQLYTGLGTANSQQFYGILNLTGTYSTSYTGAVTATTMYPYIGRTAAAVDTNRKLPMEAWLMTGQRAMWIGSSEDTATRPLALNNRNGAGEWDLLTYPVLTDDALPTNLGSGGNQDVIVAVRPSDSILLETPFRTAVMLDVLSGTLQARLQLHGYAACIHRYPTAISILSGSGMIPATGF